MNSSLQNRRISGAEARYMNAHSKREVKKFFVSRFAHVRVSRFSPTNPLVLLATCTTLWLHLKVSKVGNFSHIIGKYELCLVQKQMANAHAKPSHVFRLCASGLVSINCMLTVHFSMTERIQNLCPGTSSSV